MPERGSKKVNGASRLSNFWNFFRRDPNISCRDWRSLTKPGYITTTRRQSNSQWNGGIAAHPAPKKVSAKIHWKSSRLDFFGIKKASSSLIIFQRAKLSTRSITRLCWWNWRPFWRQIAAGRSPRGFCSCTKMPRLTWHLQPRRNWPTWASDVLITHPILRIWPRRTTTRSLDWKNNWKVAILRPMRRSWTDKLLIFFNGLQKLGQRVKKCIDLRGEYVE